MKKANTKIKSLKVKSFTTKEAKNLEGGYTTNTCANCTHYPACHVSANMIE